MNLQLHCVDGGSIEVAASELCRLSPVFRGMLTADDGDRGSKTPQQVAVKEACSGGDSSSPNQPKPGSSTGASAMILLPVDDTSKSWEELLGLIGAQGFLLAGARAGSPPAAATAVTWVRKSPPSILRHLCTWVHAREAITLFVPRPS